MLDIKYIREHSAIVQQAAKHKGIDINIEQLLLVDDQRRSVQKKLDDLRAEQGRANQAIAQAVAEDKATRIATMRTLADTIKILEQEFQTVDQLFEQLMYQVPNVPANTVPIGADASANVELSTVGQPPVFSFTPLDHLTLGKQLKLIDAERGVKVAGSRAYYLTGRGAQLELALMCYGLDFLRARGFTQLATPLMAAGEFFYGTGHFPWNENETFKALDKDREYYLIGSAEITLCAYHAHETLQQAELPKRYTAWTPCFRTEVGSYGKDTKGLYRVRQFNKVEQVMLCVNDDTSAMQLFEELMRNAEDFLQSLELPYRVMELCTGDMGAGQKYKRDIETWMPSRQSYGETHSCSWLGDFQARRLNLRYRVAGKTNYCQTLNNTLVASPRMLIPLLENHQHADGSVQLPAVLHKYMNGLTVLKPE
ncbi:MAG: serine--tRNA ligase [Candidatus Kerfeldbacteria bacterium]|nr:serine--tRNA ligase [Candidatus Kerfeldbacteria bacterium]